MTPSTLPSAPFVAGGVEVAAVVVTAMDDEAAPFLERASTVGDPVRFGNADHRLIEIDGHPLLLIRSGIGLVNAANAATEAILRTRVDATSPLVISAGSAGGVGPDVSVGEVVVGSTHVNADAEAQVFGYAAGQSPGMPPTYGPDAATLAAIDALSASGTLRDAVRAPLVVRHGLVVSSDGFIAGGPAVASLRERFPEALATDMESVGLAQTCFVYGTPFVSVRGISDLGDPSATDAHLTHVDDASDRSARVVLALLAAL